MLHKKNIMGIAVFVCSFIWYVLNVIQPGLNAKVIATAELNEKEREEEKRAGVGLLKFSFGNDS